MKVSIIGYGGRGHIYARYFQEDERVQIVAVCDKKPQKIQEALEDIRGLTAENTYLKDTEFFAQGKLADLLVVSTQDADHYGHAMKALEIGYDLLLEKPISDSLERCLDIYHRAKELGRKVFICHVLRYAPAFVKAAELLQQGAIGQLVVIDALERVGYMHQAHSYVRGNWRNLSVSAPMILAKCCHDLDLLQFYANSKCKSISSIGDLVYFKKENEPAGATDRCIDCPHKDSCPYSAKAHYLDG
jgi:predicted dehydrogenase